jgi:diguanylate cyclase (GGDEF)-like protein/putative nucleotidyltransferase with HDIG domain
MTYTARAYIALIVCAGAFLLVFGSALSFSCADPLRFAAYLSLAIIAAGSKVKLPGVTGTSSVGFIFVLLATIELSVSEVLVIACSAALTQCLWRPKASPRPIQVTFSVAAIAVAASAAYGAVQLTSPFVAEAPLIAVIASIVYFTTNTTQVAIVISLTEDRPLAQVFRQNYQWSFPHYLMSGVAVGVLNPVNPAVGWRSAVVLVPLVYWLYRTHRLYVHQLEMERNHVQEMEELHIRTIEALALAIEAKDFDTNNHLRRVEVYAVEVGKELRLADGDLKALRTAALLHDIGKLAVPEHIISKPGRLTAEEFDKVKIHPAIGAQILERVHFPYPVVPIVRCHHEKWDGSGYPDGLKGEEIPLGARILSAVDCLDGLASDRPYRPALPLQEAIAKVASEAGKSFDPRVVSVLAKKYIELERLAKASSNGRSPFSRESMRFNNSEPGAGLQPTNRVDALSYDFMSHIGAARQEAQNLLELTHELGTSLSLEDTMSLLAAKLKRMIPFEALALFAAKGDRLAPLYATGDDSWWLASLDIPIGDGLCGWVAQNKQAIINGNPAVERGNRSDRENIETPLQAALAVPLGSTAGALGVLALYRREKDSFTPDNLRILLAVADKVAISVENAMRYRQAQAFAATDALTGLPNARSLFMHLDAELGRCQRTRRTLSVLVFDLDGFKHINDRFGHLQGNRTLRAIANALNAHRRDHDYIARMGGDEFVVILQDRSDDAAQRQHALFAEIAASVAREISLGATLSVSMGQAHYPDDGHEAEQLLAVADHRMYVNKQRSTVYQQSDVANAGRWTREYTRMIESAAHQDYKN